MCCLPELRAAGVRPVVEDAVCAVVARHGFKKVVRTVGADVLVGLLAVVASLGEISIQ